jgi:xanthine dehydrogenase accessory factor
VKVLQAAAVAIRDGVPAALVTITGIAGSTPRSGGTRMLVYSDGAILGTVGGGSFEFKIIQEAIASIQEGKPRRYTAHLTMDLGMCCGGAMEAYIEPLEGQLDLVIYGAGHVGLATAKAANDVGFKVTVIDPRQEFANPELFPKGVRVIEANPTESLDDLPWGLSSYHLIVTHDHGLDQDIIEQALPRPCGWIGMIGSRTKVTKFFVRLRAGGMDEALFEKLSAPVGLDIGAETPQEIGVSIVAELIRVRRHSTKNPGPLSAIAIKARGGKGVSAPPAWKALTMDE